MRWLELLTVIVLGSSALGCLAAVQTRTVTYTYEGVTFKGFLAWDDALPGKRPGVLVVHEWWGLNDYARQRARQLAERGYVAFAADMYGDGKVTEHPQEAMQFATAVRQKLKSWQGRARAALQVLAADEHVDASRLAAIGYCFGGSTALQLAYTGADLKAVVTFHAALPIPTPEQAKVIKARLLICHGAADKLIPEETAQQFRAALEQAGVDYQMIYFGGAVHSFTVPGAEKHKNPNMAYHPAADRRSWAAMLRLFDEVFAPPAAGSTSSRP